MRAAVPTVIRQDVPIAGSVDEKGIDLGDIGFDAAIGKTFASGVVMLGGVVGTLPTATDDALGKDHSSLGRSYWLRRPPRRG